MVICLANSAEGGVYFEGLADFLRFVAVSRYIGFTSGLSLSLLDRGWFIEFMLVCWYVDKIWFLVSV